MHVYVFVCIYMYMRACVCVFVYVYSEISVLKKKEFCDKMDEPWHYVKWKKKKNSHRRTNLA